MSSSAASPVDVGRALRRARQRRHVAQDDAAQATRIPRRFLEALEANAPLDTYPAPVYARAFLREYATFLRIDPEPLLQQFGSQPAEEEPVLRAIHEAVPPPRRWPGRALLALSIVLLVGLAGAGWLSGRGDLPSIAAIQQQARSSGSSGHHGPAAPPSPAPKIRFALHVLHRSWVRALVDGKVVASQVFRPGHWHSFTARRSARITIGNAGGVRLKVNGKMVPTGAPGQVLHLKFGWHDGRVTVTRA